MRFSPVTASTLNLSLPEAPTAAEAAENNPEMIPVIALFIALTIPR